ncbi:MAG TPA: lactonase family protein [Vicinamibacterales bacterium]|nr:lactonase family protein [Vicinamibacterales bacterium]
MNDDFSRRDFFALLAAGLVAGTTAPQAQSGKRLFAYVASWTSGPGIGVGNGGGISVFSVDVATGTLAPVMRTGQEFDRMNTGYLAVNPNGRFLYATNEVESYDNEYGGGAVLTFAINQVDGTIAHVGTQPSMGVWPAYISIDKAGSRVAVANHGNYDPSVRVVKKNGVPEIEKVWDDGTVALLPVKADGTVDRASDVAVLDRIQSVDKVTQRSAHAHSVNWDPSSRMVVACDKGCDRVYTYRVADGSRTLAAGKALATEPGIAPRHSSFHPRLPYVFVVNERQSSLSSYQYDAQTADIRLVQTIPTIPGDYTMNNSPADVHVHPNGRFVYSSNRGHNSIAIFRIDEASGRMTLVDIVSTQGATPRGFNFEPGGRFLFAGNQGTGNIVTFAVDGETGKLTPTGAKVEVPRPVCVQFAMI